MRATTDLAADEEFAVLTTPLGQRMLAEMREIAKPGVLDLERWRKNASFDRVAAAMRLSESRRRGISKFARAGAMWFDPIALEQATSEVVARHKALRFKGNLAVDLCCGIGGDALALAERCTGVIAVDRDIGMLRRARWNASVHDRSHQSLFVQAAAERLRIPPDAFVHIDPDRRARSASRAQKLEGYSPGLEFLHRLIANTRGGAIKLGPASDFDTHFARESCEIEVVSLHGECKEATLWFGDLKTSRRRATALPSGESWTEAKGKAGLSPLGPRLFEPDPSLIRSGLLDGFAASFRLCRFVADIDLLTGRDPVNSAMVTEFQVESVFPLDFKTLKRELLLREVGRLEIKTRGIDVRPEEFRRKLALEGPNETTLFLVGGSAKNQAIFASRVLR